MRARLPVLLLALVLVAPTSATGQLAAERTTPKPPAPGTKHTWAEADKTGFGTARTRGSRAWFTLQGGRVSEVFFPDLSTPSVRGLELVVSDGATVTDRAVDMRTTVTRPDARSLRFTQVSTDRDGRYRLTQEYVADPRRSSVLVGVRLESLDGAAYSLYALLDPALANTGMDDRARTAGDALVAIDSKRPVASALVSRPRFDRTSNGYLGTTDGWRDLREDHSLDKIRGRLRTPGNVVQTGRIRGVTGLAGAQDATLSLGFGRTGAGAARTARATRAAGWTRTATGYDAGWHRYLDSLRRVPASATGVRRQYLASALVVAAAEDKAHPGAIVASPSAPWVWGDDVKDLSRPSGAYHLVWSRDAYQFGTALWAVGDRAAARRVVDWLFDVQQRPDGSFPQNSDVAGRPVWSELQLDEVALPIALASLTGRTGPRTWPGVRKAARFLVRFRDEETGRAAPYSPQERWENQAGYSPNSIAAQVTGLVAAARIARLNHAPALAARWLKVADRWQARVKRWTVTTNGPLATAPYFLRLTKDGRPDRGTRYAIGDGGPEAVDQRRVVDPSFLDLVRYGVLPADDPTVVSSLRVVDQRLRVLTPNGPFWHRFSFDGYGETRSGGQWEITDPGTGTTLGRGWPLLTGERGEYAVAAGRGGSSYLAAMAAASSPGDMLSEQVWDGRRPTGRACCPAGEGTRAATPLVWSHAGLVRLAWTIEDGRPVDQQGIVARRYLR